MTAFAEIQFPPEISYGSKGGPMFSTDIVTSFNGYEQRVINWSQARARYDVASGIKSETQWQELISFFRARRGRAVGFRFKDWSDYQGVGERIGTGDGSKREFQLVKQYVSGDYSYKRIISKPVNSKFLKVYVDSELINVNRGADDEEIEEGNNATIDFATGIVTFENAPRQDAVISADFEFDVPVRFDTDHLDLSIDSFQIGNWQNIPLVEIRI